MSRNFTKHHELLVRKAFTTIKPPSVFFSTSRVAVMPPRTQEVRTTSSVVTMNDTPLKNWPAPTAALEAARVFLKECAAAQQTTLLVPDKDADGLSGGCIIWRTLLLLGLEKKHLRVHFVAKGSNVHDPEEKLRMKAYNAKYAIIVDQGSQEGPPLVPGNDTDEAVKTLLIDHHESDEFLEDALVLSACKHKPVATSAMLAYELCLPLHKEVADQCDYLCAIGTVGDLAASLWEPPFSDMELCFKRYTKKSINDAVSLVNAPRRTALFDVESAWKAVVFSRCPANIIATDSQYTPRLLAARAEVSAEVARCARMPLTFSGDGKVALVRISSRAQVHNVIATRWAGTLKSPRLQVVMVANTGYMPGIVHFSCRVTRQARATADVNIIDMLKSYADKKPGLREKMGSNFARGHKQASGGKVKAEDFKSLWNVMAQREPVTVPSEPRKWVK
ncbi:DHH phosphoesterase [Heliocybe sulcata]|uniref:DHH phosphoesterase n=1 Tax=Heliocybe sulcata TaxID=5364 RepID=A0A5C3MNC2_9AGAM|nr:DHH phosphoesterase [Heliocybe sulcata]